MKRVHAAVLAVVLGLIGAVAIFYFERPVVRESVDISGEGNVMVGEESVSPSFDEDGIAVFTMTEVAAHGDVASCWSAINGGVYDLTEWIPRHPGGPENIIKLCGRDGSSDFNAQHGSFREAIDTLILFKIGILSDTP